jgi:hypothetical protein
MTVNRIKARLEQLERERQQAAIAKAEYHFRMLEQFQADLGLPLPEGVPAEVMREAERRIVAMRDAICANRNDQTPAHEFRQWVLSIHQQYGGGNAKR